MKILLLGATGTIGRATHRALLNRGHETICLLRPGTTPPTGDHRTIDLADPAAITLRGDRFDAILSCMASRTGAPADAWAVDHQAHLNILHAAQAAGIGRFVLLSAICVQKPRLPFQHAKLAFEAALAQSGLAQSGLAYAIVRPTAFFKSLSGQIPRLRRGKPFLLFGDGTQTACKPIADDDLAEYLVDQLDHCRNEILPIGGPGPAITPRQQGEALFALLGQPPNFRQLPVALLDAIIAILAAAAPLSRRAAEKAELARIGRYYATESMLLLDPATNRYDAEATPETGTRSLLDHYRHLIATGADPNLGSHAVF